jgi:catechol 2,3-dioxygenase-like lactoylglutathione lyase family enzyme
MPFPKAEIHLDVGDAEQSVIFYEALLGARPARPVPGTAVFDLESPPLILTVEQRGTARAITLGPAPERKVGRGRGRGKKRGASLARFDLLVNDARHVGDAAIALRRAGARLLLQDRGIEAHDPDGNAWRVRLAPAAKRRTLVTV